MDFPKSLRSSISSTSMSVLSFQTDGRSSNTSREDSLSGVPKKSNSIFPRTSRMVRLSRVMSFARSSKENLFSTLTFFITFWSTPTLSQKNGRGNISSSGELSTMTLMAIWVSVASAGVAAPGAGATAGSAMAGTLIIPLSSPPIRALAFVALTFWIICPLPSGGTLDLRCLGWGGGSWNWSYDWLDNDWNSDNPALVPATLFISLSKRESFVYPAVLSTHLTFFQLHLFLQIRQYISYYPKTLLPRESLKIFSKHPLF